MPQACPGLGGMLPGAQRGGAYFILVPQAFCTLWLRVPTPHTFPCLPPSPLPPSPLLLPLCAWSALLWVQLMDYAYPLSVYEHGAAQGLVLLNLTSTYSSAVDALE
jgi:hypothetical protein